MRILHFHDPCRLETGGMVRAVFDMARGAAEAGHEVTLGTVRGDDVPAEWISAEPGCPRGVFLERAFLPGRFFTRRGLRQTLDLLHETQVLHLHGVWEPFQTQLCGQARRAGVPYVCSLHGHLADWGLARRSLKKKIWLAVAGEQVLRGAAAIHGTTGTELEQARRWIPARRGVVIPLPFDLRDYQTLPGPHAARARFPELQKGDPILLFLSRLHPGKGIEHLLRAVVELKARGRRCLTVIAGTGADDYERDLHRLAQRLDVAGSVLFAGHVAGELKISLYQAADLFVLPTSYESFGFVLFESMAACTPVLTTRGALTWEELEESGGARIGSAEPVALADGITELLDDPSRREAMGQAGRRWVLASFSAERTIRQFEELYETVRSES